MEMIGAVIGVRDGDGGGGDDDGDDRGAVDGGSVLSSSALSDPKLSGSEPDPITNGFINRPYCFEIGFPMTR